MDHGSWILEGERGGERPGGRLVVHLHARLGTSLAEARQKDDGRVQTAPDAALDRHLTRDARPATRAQAARRRRLQPCPCDPRGRPSARGVPARHRVLLRGRREAHAHTPIPLAGRRGPWPWLRASPVLLSPRERTQRGGRPRASETTQRVAQPPPASLGLPPPTLPTSAPARSSRGLDTLRAASAASSGISDSSASGPPAWVRVAEANVHLQITMTAINLHVLA